MRVEGLSKSYSKGGGVVHALRGLDLELERGEHLAISGASGSGKSTLLHILACLDRPTSGSYWLDDHDVAQYSDRERSGLRATRIAIVFQTFNLVPELDVRENVELPFRYGELSRTEGRERAQRAIERVGLAERREHRPAELSGGEMQRVAIARALAIDPLLILADEPTGNLDSRTGGEILALFERLHDDGASMIVVTHDPAVAARAERHLVMVDGCLHAPERLP